MSQTRYLTEAYNSFVTGCKSDGIWDAIKAACVMAGWDGLAGGLTPLKGTAPTNTGFVAADWNRKTGLVGDATAKYLNTNRACNADPQDSCHVAFFATTADNNVDRAYFRTNLKIAVATGPNISSGINFTSIVGHANINNSSFFGLSRSSSASYTRRLNGASSTVSDASLAPNSDSLNFYRRAETNTQYSQARLAFYSMGGALDLALLEARVVRLLDDIAFVLNYGLSPLAYNADAINWANRVVDAGATVSASTLTAVNTFCNAVDAAGIRDRFTRLNVFAGSSLTAALVPLYRSSTYGGAVVGNATDTNNNFVSGDFAETGTSAGLKGNGTNKTLDTGYKILGAGAPTAASGHLSIHMLSVPSSRVAQIGVRNDSAPTTVAAIDADETTKRIWGGYGTSFQFNPATHSLSSPVHLMLSNVSGGDLSFYANGGLVSSAAAQTPNTLERNLLVFTTALGTGSSTTGVSSGRVGAYSIGASMTTTQVSAFYAALSAFNTALGRFPPTVSNVEAQDWVNRVYAAGGTVSQSTADAVNAFCSSIEQSGIRSRFLRLNLFAGNDLTAALVPLYRSSAYGGTVIGNETDTNNSFASSDYVERGSSGGLKGNGSSKALNTGVTFSAVPVENCVFAVYAADMETTGVSVAYSLIGNTRSNASFVGANLQSVWGYSGAQRRMENSATGGAVVSQTGTLPAAAFVSAGHVSGTSYAIYSNGVSVASATATVTSQTTNTVPPITVFGRNDSPNNTSSTPVITNFTSARMRSYSIGISMTDAQQLSYYNAMQAFQVSLNRSV